MIHAVFTDMEELNSGIIIVGIFKTQSETSCRF